MPQQIPIFRLYCFHISFLTLFLSGFNGQYIYNNDNQGHGYHNFYKPNPSYHQYGTLKVSPQLSSSKNGDPISNPSILAKIFEVPHYLNNIINEIRDKQVLEGGVVSFPTTSNINFFRHVFNVPVIGGIEASEGAYPYIASLRVGVQGVKTRHICSMILISSQYLLSAAHCFDLKFPIKYYIIGLGKHQKFESEPHEVIRKIEKVFVHYKYETETFDSDIALIKMNKPVKFNKRIQPAKLPLSTKELPEYSYCCTSGWGDTQGFGDPNVLNEVCLPSITTVKCNGSDFYNGAITNNMFCAGEDYGGFDSCRGDSGGPLVCLLGNNFTPTLSGIVSWGTGCAQAGKPGVYTKVSNFIRWILYYSQQ